MSYKGEFNPATFTWIGMAIIIAVYYPLFARIDSWSSKLSESFVRTGKKMTGRKTGAIIAFIIGLLVLYYFYGKLWFDFNILKTAI